MSKPSETDSLMSGRVLDIDMGNTRIKWRCGPASQPGSSGVAVYHSDWLRSLAAVGEGISRVRIASVAAISRNTEIMRWCESRWQVSPEFAVTAASCAGVSNGYKEPQTMGVDRWLGILAAYNRIRQACMVVDCGSAVTVDTVLASGAHLGGYIVPGWQLMRRALGRDTEAVNVTETQVSEGLAPGCETGEAVNNGLMLMLVGLIAQSWQQLQHETNRQPALILTGGDAMIVRPHLPYVVQIVPELVLEGLALAMP